MNIASKTPESENRVGASAFDSLQISTILNYLIDLNFSWNLIKLKELFINPTVNYAFSALVLRIALKIQRRRLNLRRIPVKLILSIIESNIEIRKSVKISHKKLDETKPNRGRNDLESKCWSLVERAQNEAAKC